MDEEYKQADAHGSDEGNGSKPTKIEVTDDFANHDVPSNSATNPPDVMLVIGEETPKPAVDEEPSVGHEEPKNPVIEAEIEPETVAFTADPLVPAAPMTPLLTNKKSTMAAPKDKKRLMIIAASGVALVAVVAIAALLLLKDTNDPVVDTVVETPPAVAEVAKINVTVSTVSGAAGYFSDTKEWLPLSESVKLKEGDSVRTGADSRVTLSLTNGSAIRLDSDSMMEIVSLSSDAVDVKLTGGSIYSRVVSSDHTYSVTFDGATIAKANGGTAFVTTAGTAQSMIGVQVFQGSIKLSSISEGGVAEGKQYLWPFGDFTGTIAVADIDIDTLADDDFVLWNIQEDEKNKDFSSAMGILPTVKQRAESLKTERAAAEEQRQRDEKEAAEKEAARKLEAEEKTNEEEKVSRAGQNRSARMGAFMGKRQ